MLTVTALTGSVTDAVVTRACAGCWAGSLFLLGGFHCPVRGKVCSLLLEPKSPDVSELHFWSLLQGRQDWKDSQVVLVVKNLPANAEDRCRFDPWFGKIPWRRAWQPTPVFLTRESHGRRAWRATVHRVAQSRTGLVTYKCRQVGLEHSFWVRSPWVLFPGAAHLWVCSAVSPFTHCVDSQSTLLLSLPSALPQPWACQRLALVPLRLCVHKASRTFELKSQGCRAISGTHWGSCGESSDAGPAQPLHACIHKAHGCQGQTPPSSGAPAVPLDVLYVLNSQSWWRRCNSVSVLPWIEISFLFPKSHAPGTQLWFQPHLCAWATHWCLVPGCPGGGGG